MADEKKKRNKKKKRGGGSKKKMTTEQTEAFKSVTDWLFVGSSPPLSSSSDDFAVTINNSGSLKSGEKLVFELHSHSNCSDGFLSPSKLVEKAHNNGVSFRFCSFVDSDL